MTRIKIPTEAVLFWCLLALLGYLFMLTDAHAASRAAFYDFEAGTVSNSNGNVVATADDGRPPYQGTKQLRLNWDGVRKASCAQRDDQGNCQGWADPLADETWNVTLPAYTNCFLLRYKERLDNNFDYPSDGAKFLRWESSAGSNSISQLDAVTSNGALHDSWCDNEGSCNNDLINVWKSNIGPQWATRNWHEVAVYACTGGSATIKRWDDGVLTYSGTGTKSDKLTGVHFHSNWSVGTNADGSDAGHPTSWNHNAQNATYIDNVEIYSDNGTGATGLLSDNTAGPGGGATPTPNPTVGPTPTPGPTAAPTATPTPTTAPAGPLPIFPGAQGWGTDTTAARRAGVTVIKVTNTNDTGTGSLRACMLASVPRICVFTVGGTINLNSSIYVTSPYMAVLGQTAPGGGIQIIGKNIPGHALMIETHDVLLQYLRVRMGYNSSVNGTNIGNSPIDVANATDNYNGVYDHLSTGFAQDDVIQIWRSGSPRSDNITVSNTIIGSSIFTGSYGQSTSLLMGGSSTAYADGMSHIDMHHNLITNMDHRNPKCATPTCRIVNNIFYNHNNAYNQIGGGSTADIIGNEYKIGPATIAHWGSNVSYHEIKAWNSHNEGEPTGDPSLYLLGNIGWHAPTPNSDQWALAITTATANPVGETGNPITAAWRRSSPQPQSTIPLIADSATALSTIVGDTVGASRTVDCAGNWVPNRDAIDVKMIADYRAGTGPNHSLADEFDYYGGFPTIAAGTPCTDTDNDGVPDAYENRIGSNPNVADATADTNGDGYLNVEGWAYGIGPSSGPTSTPTPSPTAAGPTPTPAPGSTFTNNTAATIPDFGPASVYPYNITASGLGGTVTSVRVTINGLTHTCARDLDLLLVAPSGAQSIIFSDAGGNGGNCLPINNANVTVSSTATTPIPAEAQITTGTYAPVEVATAADDFTTGGGPAGPYTADFSVFNGVNPNGVWKVYIKDDAGGDTGTITSVSLTLTSSGGVTPTPSPTATPLPTSTPVPTATPTPVILTQGGARRVFYSQMGGASFSRSANWDLTSTTATGGALAGAKGPMILASAKTTITWTASSNNYYYVNLVPAPCINDVDVLCTDFDSKAAFTVHPFTPDQYIYYLESGRFQGQSQGLKAGDQLTIQVIGGIPKFYQNGILRYTGQPLSGRYQLEVGFKDGGNGSVMRDLSVATSTRAPVKVQRVGGQ